ncbi:helicase associated domain-containing family protein [Cryptosporidium andersoni]|uniref:RNA helicase n=1 Tax=Cryptosporidium andersoni TaxID=117008 RepID=A0A1J4MM70_9CRYT|nr:helicase associated domain-containing family protein [Cryptosporidium andersoni]
MPNIEQCLKKPRKCLDLEEKEKEGLENKGNLNHWNDNKPFSDRYYELRKFRKSLPAWSERKAFCKLLKKNQVVILVGDTGSGKTTQCPQFILKSGIHNNLKIACTQPRRIAAISIAGRVAEEMDVCLGEVVGYTIRFEDKTSNKTLLKYVTDGMLLREAIYDRNLSQYSVIILDEAHERTLSTDILMGFLKELIKKRNSESSYPLKLVIMSATLESTKFKNYFLDAPIFSIPGRMFPVDIIYNLEATDNYLDASIEKVIEIHTKEAPGDILLFLTGEDEIEQAKRGLEQLAKPLENRFGPLMIVPLYSSLPPIHQQLIFSPSPGPLYAGGPIGRKVVISTNIAETSITIDGIVYVVDPGFSKQKVYNPRTQVDSLLVSPISRSSAKQRAGRAGRTKSGKCFRLYTKSAFEKELIEQTYPEILRSNLSHIVLTLKCLGVDDLVHFDFMDPPAPETLMRALEQLYYLEALDDEGELTNLGKMMSEFPVDPQLARMLLKSSEHKCVSEILTITAILSVSNIFYRPRDKLREADEAKNRFIHADGDHLTLLNVFNAYKEAQLKSKEKYFCQDNYLNIRALQSADNVRLQLQRTLEKHHLNVLYNNSDETHSNIRFALTQGFFMQVALLQRSGHYLTVRDHQVVVLHPSCVLETRPEWVIYHEFVLTSRNYIRTVTKIKGEWLLDIAGNYYDPAEFPDSEAKKKLSSLISNRKRYS